MVRGSAGGSWAAAGGAAGGLLGSLGGKAATWLGGKTARALGNLVRSGTEDVVSDAASSALTDSRDPGTPRPLESHSTNANTWRLIRRRHAQLPRSGRLSALRSRPCAVRLSCAVEVHVVVQVVVGLVVDEPVRVHCAVADVYDSGLVVVLGGPGRP